MVKKDILIIYNILFNNKNVTFSDNKNYNVEVLLVYLKFLYLLSSMKVSLSCVIFVPYENWKQCDSISSFFLYFFSECAQKIGRLILTRIAGLFIEWNFFELRLYKLLVVLFFLSIKNIQ